MKHLLKLTAPTIPPIVFTGNTLTDRAAALDNLNQLLSAAGSTKPRHRLPKGYAITVIPDTIQADMDLGTTFGNPGATHEWCSQLKQLATEAATTPTPSNHPTGAARHLAPANEGRQNDLLPIMARPGNAPSIWWVCHVAAIRKGRTKREYDLPSISFAVVAPAPTSPLDNVRANRIITAEWLRRTAAVLQQAALHVVPTIPPSSSSHDDPLSLIPAAQQSITGTPFTKWSDYDHHATANADFADLTGTRSHRLPDGSRLIPTWLPYDTPADHPMLAAMLHVNALPPIAPADTDHTTFPLPFYVNELSEYTAVFRDPTTPTHTIHHRRKAHPIHPWQRPGEADPSTVFDRITASRYHTREVEHLRMAMSGQPYPHSEHPCANTPTVDPIELL